MEKGKPALEGWLSNTEQNRQLQAAKIIIPLWWFVK
jgi:hypothetical protein